MLFNVVNGDLLRSHIEITDVLVKQGYTRRDIMIMPIWELKEIIAIKNKKVASNDREYLVK